MKYSNKYKYIITSGKGYLDIDALACGLALEYLLKYQGVDSTFISTAQINSTVPDEFVNSIIVKKPREIRGTDRFIICDVSDPQAFDRFVEEPKIVEIIDHHFGFEAYWQGKLAENSDIRPVAACASQICERFIEAKVEPPPDLAKLLLLAIISNSLNMQLELVCDVDKKAKKYLQSLLKPDPDRAKNYFKLVQEKFTLDPIGSLELDSKIISISGKDYKFAQLEIWDESGLDFQSIFEIYAKKTEHLAILNLALTGKGHNMIFTNDPSLTSQFSSLYEGEVNKKYFRKKDSIILRKQIIRDLKGQ